MTADEVREQVTGPMCRAYMVGLEVGHMTAKQLIEWGKDELRAYHMGLHERRTGRPEAA